MPCNARVVIKATVSVSNIGRIKKVILAQGWKMEGDGMKIIMSREVTAYLEGSKLELRSTAADWDAGVAQLKFIIKRMTAEGVEFEKIDQPETHIHEPVAPWQKVSH